MLKASTFPILANMTILSPNKDPPPIVETVHEEEDGNRFESDDNLLDRDKMEASTLEYEGDLKEIT
jgi:hypothetical protein